MDDLKLYGKDESELDSFFNTVLVFCTDIGMEFGMKRRGVLILKRGNVKKSVGITLPDNCKMKSVEEDGYKNLEILEYDDLTRAQEKRFEGRIFPETKDSPVSEGKIRYLQQINGLCHSWGMELEK